MTTKDKIFTTLFGLLILTALFLYFFSPKRDIVEKPQIAATPEVSPSPAQEFAGEIEILIPQPDGVIESPLSVVGRARGTWFFEASMPVTLKDANGAVLAKVLVLVLLILFIQKRPKGIFPQKGRAAAD